MDKDARGSLGIMSGCLWVKCGRMDHSGSRVIIQGHGVVWIQSKLRTPSYPQSHGSEVIPCLTTAINSDFRATYQSKHGLHSTPSTPGAVDLHSAWIKPEYFIW